jgi:hypothetical protein
MKINRTLKGKMTRLHGIVFFLIKAFQIRCLHTAGAVFIIAMHLDGNLRQIRASMSEIMSII